MNPNPAPASPDAIPAHALWVQLATRITTQPLHYRSGEEESAVTSITSLFAKVRELIEQHPAAAQFRQVSLRLLNDTLRAYTARWHGWMTEDKERRDQDGRPLLHFRDEQVRRQFRQELRELQPELIRIREELAGLAGIAEVKSQPAPAKANLGEPLEAKVRSQVPIKTKPDKSAHPDSLATVAAINRTEAATVLRRRILLETLHKEDLPRTLDELAAATQPPPDPTAPARPLCLKDAIGLALSGGGIRSATFCLGLVQVLVRKGLFPQFDFVSTVSGGGYFGSFLSCSLGTVPSPGAGKTPKQLADEKLADVFTRKEGAARDQGVESALLRHLRNNSKYLLGGGFMGKLSIAGLLLSGVLWNILMVLPIPLGCALIASLWGPWFWGGANAAELPVLPVLTGSPSGWLLLGLASLLALGWAMLPGIQLLTHGKPPASPGALFRSQWERATLLVGFATVLAGAVFLLPALFHGHEWLRAALAGLSVGSFNFDDVAGLVPTSLTAAAGAGLALLAGWLGPQWPRLRALAVKLFILSGPLLFLLIFLLVGNRLGLAREGEAAWSVLAVVGVTVGLGLWDWFCVNINTLAPHRYYRGRICDCYLVRRLPEDATPASARVQKLSGEPVQESVQTLKQVPLTSLNADPAAPYHFINMTLNVPHSDDKNLRGRASDFFVASRHFYGSPLTGYARTEDLKEADPHFDLGTAMAVSAAAASSSMGWQSVPHLRFLLTLFNVRLGYWLRRPGVAEKGWVTEGAGPWYLFREMAGVITERCRYVNLSDGGHIENLAAYELLRRRCKFIVCVDAGHEPGMECADLLRLQRYAEIDLGLRMHFDTSDLQIQANGYSRSHAILVKIDYAPDPATREEPGLTSSQLGWMLYMKLAVTGVEPNHVKGYRRDHREFPHESTGDQIYEEEQFEAYRALGECAMEGLFRQELVGADPPANIAAWFQCLANNLLPDNDDAFPRPRPESSRSPAQG